MAVALLLLVAGFEPMEVLYPRDLLGYAGVEVITAAVSTTSKQVVGYPAVNITTDVLFSEVKDNLYDCIIVPGGEPGTENLATNLDVIKAIRHHKDNGRLVASICAAPGMVLAEAAQIMRGRAGCSYPGVDAKIAENGGTIVTNKTCNDGNILTSRGPGTSIEFSLAIVKYLMGESKAEEVRQSIVFDE